MLKQVQHDDLSTNLWKTRFAAAKLLTLKDFILTACGWKVTVAAPSYLCELFPLPPHPKTDSFMNGERGLG
jgi:hypothetical protein